MPDPSVIDVWVAPLDVAAEVQAALEAGLSEEERGRAGALHRLLDARRFCAARGWLRAVLGAELGLAPAAVPLCSGPGKPVVTGGPPFNQSRSAGVALVAVAGAEVGVDLECVVHGREWAGAATVACTEAERATLALLPPSQRAGAFLRAWTAKEAFLKGLGTGLATAPDSVEVGVPPPDPVEPGLDGRPSGWWVRSLAPAEGYVGAVAAEGDGWSVRFRDVATLHLPTPAAPGLPLENPGPTT